MIQLQLPRPKEGIVTLNKHFPQIGKLIIAAYDTFSIEESFEKVEQLLELTVKHKGF